MSVRGSAHPDWRVRRDLEVVERVPIEAGQSEENEGYLQVKRDKMGHLLSMTKK